MVDHTCQMLLIEQVVHVLNEVEINDIGATDDIDKNTVRIKCMCAGVGAQRGQKYPLPSSCGARHL